MVPGLMELLWSWDGIGRPLWKKQCTCLLKIITYIKPHCKDLKWNNREVMNSACGIGEASIKVPSLKCSERHTGMFYSPGLQQTGSWLRLYLCLPPHSPTCTQTRPPLSPSAVWLQPVFKGSVQVLLRLPWSP